jgi:hypothetical protein
MTNNEIKIPHTEHPLIKAEQELRINDVFGEDKMIKVAHLNINSWKKSEVEAARDNSDDVATRMELAALGFIKMIG